MSNHDRGGPPMHDQDAALRRAWHQASDEQPAPELDAAIIAAARKSVQDRGAGVSAMRSSRRSPNRLLRWQPLAAAAAVAGLSFILVQLLPRDRDVVPSVQMEEPAPGPAKAQKGPDSDRAEIAVPTQEALAPEAAAPQAATEEKRGTSAPTAAAPSMPAGAPDTAAEAPDTELAPSAAAEPPGTAAGGTSEGHAADADQRGAATTAMPRAAAPPTVAAAARAGSSGNAAPLSAEDRAARISALYSSGDVAGAADALRAFRAVDPDADTYLPDSLRDWARTVE